MTKKDALQVLDRKALDIIAASEKVRTSVLFDDTDLIDASVITLEREVTAFKMLVNGYQSHKNVEIK